MEIYLYRHGAQTGPFTLDEVNTKLATGEADLADQAWTPGLHQWVKLSVALNRSRCPQCKGFLWLIVEYPQRSTGIIVVVLGILLAPVCVGLILMIYGWSLAAETKRHWHCTSCGRTFPA